MWWWCLAILVGVWWIWTGWRHKQMLDGWSKKAVFVTGCDTGFGRALVLKLDSEGVPVFAGCYTEQGLRELKEIASSKLKAIHLDVTSTENITQAFEFVRDNIPSGAELWGVVNNAGLLRGIGPLEFMKRTTFEEVFQVNALGLVEVSRIFLPLLRKSRGRIVNVTSINGFVGLPCLIPYCASKYAACGITECLRRELYLYGISVHSIEPTGHMTGICGNWTKEIEENWQSLPQSIKDTYDERYPKHAVRAIEDGKKEMGKDLSPVVNADIHALFAVHPLNYYQVGKGSKLIFLASYYLPPFITDRFMRIIMGKLLPVEK